ncbi:MAG: hypothetical protein QUT30_16335 [Acidobacteriota bacterium]|nr:hypothetical protein [Acidobacteriota bacterium]
MLIQTDYKSVRCRIRPGDIIAFSGSGRISRLIQFFTRSVVSHVGIVFEILERDVRRVKLMESTTLDGLQGVQETYLSERIQTYSGPVWWLPLSEKVRSQMDQGRFWKALFDANGRPYDYRQVLHHGIDWLRLRSQGESPGRLYCSELCALALKSGYALPVWINSSEVRPDDLCAFRIYSNNYYQLCGKPTEIRRYNSEDPLLWKN